MEPNDLNSTPAGDAALEAWLRANAALPPLPADRFTAGVLGAVRPRRISRGPFLALGLVVGIAVAVSGAVTSGNSLPSLPAIDAELTEAFSQLSSLPVAGGLVLTGISLGYAFRDRLRLLPRL
jgi:hypothetical protein